MTELTTPTPWFSIISSQEAFILSKPYFSLTSLTTLRFWITLVTDTQRRSEYNRMQRVVFGSTTCYLLGESYPEITNYMEKGPSWKANNRSASKEICLFIEPKFHYVFTRARHWPLSSSHPTSFLTLYPHLLLGFPRKLLLQCVPTKIILLRPKLVALWIPTVHIQAVLLLCPQHSCCHRSFMAYNAGNSVRFWALQFNLPCCSLELCTSSF